MTMLRFLRYVSTNKKYYNSSFRTYSQQKSGTSKYKSSYHRVPTANIVDPDQELPEPGYGPDDDDHDIILTKKQLTEMKQVMKREFRLWLDEWKERFKNDPVIVFDYGIVYKIYDFSKEEDFAKWVCTSDSEQGCGFSTCTWTRSPNGRGLFSGNLSVQVPDDGKTARSGFCAVNGPRAMKSFLRKDFLDWAQYTHIVFKLRGDGRTYNVHLREQGYFDLSWYRSHSYVLHTRGGPYWQIAKLPFSKFIFTSQGSTQSQHDAPFLQEITSFGITLCDDIEGPFNLEIEYIGLETDFGHDEECAYEYYHVTQYDE